MTFQHFNRRTHLYLGLFLLPWFFVYGISSVPFAHNQFFDQRDRAKNLPNWNLRSEHTVDLAVPEGEEALREFGGHLLRQAGIAEPKTWGAYRQSPTQVNVYLYSPLQSTQLRYLVDQKKLFVEDKRFRWDHFLTGLHALGGFEQASTLRDSWAIVVDLVCLAMILWIASGLYMWWAYPGHRNWGWLAIFSGAASFAWFTLRL